MPTLFENQHTPTATLQPVTVLGRTFVNDDERRTYFREELRKQLPELKKIEGFPIGDDEDILNLSDPPFYTACPNPWINDFITEWEAEKIELQKQGKRLYDFEVDEPYASDVSEGKNNPIYNAHSYHTKVPHPAIMRYILHYTQPGDIVFDGFAGTGMTGVAAGMCGNPDTEIKATIEKELKSAGLHSPDWGTRQAVCSDLSPIASFIGFNNNMPKNYSLIEIKVKDILKKIKEDFGWMYQTKHTNNATANINYVIWSEVFTCPECLSEIEYWKEARDSEGNIQNSFSCPNCSTSVSKSTLNRLYVSKYDINLNSSVKQPKYVPALINYSFSGKRYEKRPDQNDLITLEKINNLEINSWFPKDEIIEGVKTNDPIRFGFTHTHHLYFKRSLFILSRFWELTLNLPILRFAATSVLVKTASLLHNVGVKNGKINLAGALPNAMYIPSTIAERNISELLIGKLSDIEKICSIKTPFNCSQIESATDIRNINSDSIDYIFTDPPFGANLMYSELNFVHESWLKVKTNAKDEAIENRKQNKNLFDYQRLMISSFTEFFRVLKPNKWMTVEFSNTSASVWNSIQISLQRAGFVISNVRGLDKQQGSFNAQTTLTAVKQDLVISCYKPSSEFDHKFQQSQHSEVGIWDFVAEHLNHLPVHLNKGNATTAVIERSPKILFDRLIAFYVQRSLPVPIDAALFQKGLKERFIERDGMYFTAEQVHEYDSKKAELPNFVQLSLLVASEQDGVMWLRRELETTPQTYQELQPNWMQALAGVRKGDILPELKDILEDNFLQDESGHWYLPDLENEIDLEKVRTRRMLKLFDNYREQALKPKGKIKEARVEALRVGFKQCYKDKDFKTIVMIGDSIPNNLLMEDEVLLQYYDIAISRV